MKNHSSGMYSHDKAAAEETLRLIATLPAPRGLEQRVQEKLRAAPRQARILAWPARGQAGSWMRGAAAAAIVCVVAGGGWRIYSHVQPAQATRGQALPPQVSAGGGFANAGAMRTPETLTPPAAPAQQKPGTAVAKKTAQPAKAKAAVHRTAAGRQGAPQ